MRNNFLLYWTFSYAPYNVIAFHFLCFSFGISSMPLFFIALPIIATAFLALKDVNEKRIKLIGIINNFYSA